MSNKSCIGCRTSFEQSEELGLENLTVEFKNYQIPLKDDLAKWDLLKAILSFMNSKGGTIYIGIQHKKGAVRGIFLQRKERDSFKLTIKQLLQKIYPKVDLNNRQEVQIEFVPVFRGTSFQGKFVVKIIVQQGDPSQVYCISERIKLDGGPNYKIDDFQVFYAYERHNMGGAEQIKGVKLMNLIRQRALKPNKAASIFHENCNPPPPYLQVQIRTIMFTSITQQQHKILETVYKSYFQSEEIDYQDKHTIQNCCTQIYIEDEEQFNIVKQFITDKVTFLNEIFLDSGCPACFQIKGQVFHYFSVVNNQRKQKPKRDHEKEKSGKKQQNKKQNKFPYREKTGNQKKQVQSKTPVHKNQVKRQLEHMRENKQSNSREKEDQFVITFTHIEPRSIETLQRFLRQRIYRVYNKKFNHYFNTLQMILQSDKQRQNFLAQLLIKENQLSSYGFKQEIRYGINSRELKICNVNWQKGGQLKTYLKEQMKDQLEGFKHEKNALVCQMKSRQAACVWLDNLLVQRKFKQRFSMKGAAQNKVAKIKVYLNVGKVVKSQN